MKKICDKCGGSGTLPEEPKTPPVITVRIKRCSSCNWYEDSLGRIFDVTDNAKFGNYRYTYLSFIAKEDCEVIPPYDKTKFRLRRKWGKDEEWVGAHDLVWDGEMWVYTSNCREPQGQRIFITPLPPKQATPEPLMVDCPSLDILLSKQSTPDPSADCLQKKIEKIKTILDSIL